MRVFTVDSVSEKRSVLSVAIVSSFATPFMASAVNVALPSIQKEFAMDTILLAWVATSYLVSCAVFLVPLARMGDIYGRKKIFIYGISMFTVASGLAAASPSSPVLLAARVLQGMGSAMIFATSMAILTSVFPPQDRGKAIGLTVGAVYIGLSAGPFLGGILTRCYTWRAVFAVAVPLGLVAIYVALTKLKGEWIPARGEKPDVIGSIFYAGAITFVIHGFSTLPSVQSLLEIGVGLLFGVAFVWWELRVAYPVFNLDLFRNNRAFTFSSLAALINYSATFAVTFVLSLYLQYIKGLDAQSAGLVLMACPIVMAVFSPSAGRLSDRIEPRKVASLGMTVTAAALFMMACPAFRAAIWHIVLELILLGFGFALFSSPNMNAIMSSVEPPYYGLASGAVGSMRILGQTFSMGIATMVFALLMGKTQISPQLFPAFIESVNMAFVIFGSLCVVGIFFSLARGKIRS